MLHLFISSFYSSVPSFMHFYVPLLHLCPHLHIFVLFLQCCALINSFSVLFFDFVPSLIPSLFSFQSCVPSSIFSLSSFYSFVTSLILSLCPLFTAMCPHSHFSMFFFLQFCVLIHTSLPSFYRSVSSFTPLSVLY